MEFVKKNALGILICLVIAVPAWLLGQRFEVVGGPVFAILIGMVIALFWKDQKAAKSGITYTSKKILQLAVVLLGFGMNLGSVLQVGGQSLPIIVSTIATSLIVAFVLYKALRMDANISTLIGVGSSICGGSAIAATAPVIGADDEEIAQAISVIFLFNVIAALIFPTLRRHGGERHLLRHRGGLRLGRDAPRRQYPGHRRHREDDPDPGHHPHHPGAGPAADPPGGEAGRRPGGY